MNITLFQFFIIASGVWRIASLIANEAGPFGIFEFLRETAERLEENGKGIGRWMREFRFSEGMGCEWCNSLWQSIPLTLAVLWLGGEIVAMVLLPFAISAWALVLKYTVQTLRSADEKLHLDRHAPRQINMTAFKKALAEEFRRLEMEE